MIMDSTATRSLGGISIRSLTGPQLTAALPALAALRIEVFRNWPYLYNGTTDYEAKYVENFARGTGSVIVAAFDGTEIIGVATAAPMVEHAAEFAAPFAASGHDISKIFYLSESVLKVSYRGRGIGHAFFDLREAHARALGDFTHAAFCGVVRSADHPLRPHDYVPLDAFWQKRGYTKQDGLLAHFDWLDVDQSEPTSKPMQFWMRAL
jgi:GNAT superfamily N-acetyltransferase